MENKNSLGSRIQVRKIVKKGKSLGLAKKLFLINISVLVLLLGIYFIGFSKIFDEYIMCKMQNSMREGLGVITSQLLNSSDPVTREDLVINISRCLKEKYDSIDYAVWIMDEDGEGISINKNSVRSITPSLYQIRLKQALNNGSLDTGVDLEGDIMLPLITVGTDIELEDGVKYAIYMHTSLYQVSEIINKIRSAILTVISIVCIALFIIGYGMYKKIVSSLRELNSTAMTIASGHFYNRVEITGNDEIAQLGDTFNYMAMELDKIEDVRRSFISNVSHDLRSPLTSIKGYVTAILDGTIPPENQEKYLNIVLNEATRMVTMTNQILELNKTEESREKLTKTVFNINEVIEQNMDSLENRVKEKNISLTKRLNTESSEVVGNVSDITRVVQNLLDNALKFVDENGFIEVRTAIRGKRLWVAIYNSGPAIPKEHQTEIWNKFYKGDTSRGIDKLGIGLGLVIVREIISQHGEIVGVHSEEGEPVIFYFSLSMPNKA